LKAGALSAETLGKRRKRRKRRKKKKT